MKPVEQIKNIAGQDFHVIERFPKVGSPIVDIRPVRKRMLAARAAMIEQHENLLEQLARPPEVTGPEQPTE